MVLLPRPVPHWSVTVKLKTRHGIRHTVTVILQHTTYYQTKQGIETSPWLHAAPPTYQWEIGPSLGFKLPQRDKLDNVPLHLPPLAIHQRGVISIQCLLCSRRECALLSVRVPCLYHAPTKTWKWITTTYSVGTYIHTYCTYIGTYIFYTYSVTMQ